jgi:aspartate/methionine/tyrosine aminotransferase
MLAVRPDISRLEQNGITGIAFPRMNDPSVIPLWFGEGDMVTPEFIRNAAKLALDNGHTFYNHTRGIPELRLAVREYLNQLYGTNLNEDRVSIPGSSMLCVTIAAQMALNKGDDALVVSPHWPNIRATYAVTGANIVTVRQRETKTGWELTADEIIAAVTPRTKSIYVNSPCNPTGWVMGRLDQQKLLAYCRENEILLIADEVYHRHYYSGRAAPSFVEIADDEDPVVVVNGFSKAWAMTGWRVGWVVAPKAQATHWAIMSECFNTGATVFAQYACVIALKEGEPTVDQLKSQYEKGRSLLVDCFADHPAIDLCLPEGAFYAFPRIRGLRSSRRFAEALLEEEDVGVAPGYTFGTGNDEYIRVCFAMSHDRLKEGLDRIVRFVSKHHNSL